MAEAHDHEFLSLQDARPPFPSDEDSGSSPFDSLWTEFTRSHPRLSPPRTPTHREMPSVASLETSTIRVKESKIELRALDYVSDYDSNLMCPICHVPFIDPVVLDCDHTFCAECFDEYRNGGPSTDRSKCPSCRSYHLGGSRKASRLIRNMCSDILVRCPNLGCGSVVARGCIEQHAMKDCPEHEMSCPDAECQKKTKRKNFVPEQCIHNTYIECDCGASIRLGRREWIKHKDEHCPNTAQSYHNTTPPSTSRDRDTPRKISCPGADFGCTDEIDPSEIDIHAQSCPLARLAPALKKQASLLRSLTEQLKMTKTRNEVLETGFERLNDIITTMIQPKLENLIPDIDNTSDTDIEEIPRDDLPSPTRRRHDLSVLPAHHCELTPSPSHGQHYHQHAADPYIYYNDLNPRLTTVESEVSTLQTRLTDLDARSSMALMNETLRIREELAHINGAMYSTRAQVQWLLNRERILGQREAMANGGAGMIGRGRQGQTQTQTQGMAACGSGTGGANGPGNVPAGTQAGQTAMPGPSAAAQRPSIDRNMSSAWSTVSQSQTSGPSSAATSPMFGAARPSIRRSSGGGSQERVKL